MKKNKPPRLKKPLKKKLLRWCLPRLDENLWVCKGGSCYVGSIVCGGACNVGSSENSSNE